MASVLYAGAKAGLSALPGGGFFVDLLEKIEEASDKRKYADEQLIQLDFVLSKWFEDNSSKTTAGASTSDAVGKNSTTTTDAGTTDATDKESTTATDAVDEENAESVVDEIRKTIKDFHEYVQAKRKERNPENMRKRDKLKAWVLELLHTTENEAITQRILVFKQEIQLSMYRLIIDSYELTRKIDDTTCGIKATTTETRDVVRLIKTELTNFIENSRHDGFDLSKNEIELMMRIDKGDSNEDDWTKLMHLFSTKPAKERLKLSLQLIGLNNDNAKRMGLFNLNDLLHGDLNGHDIDGVLMDLIELAHGVNEEVKKRALAVLETIAEKDELKAQFFKRVRVLSECKVKRQAIAKTIAALILDCARKVRESEESPERDAFDALQNLVKTDSCSLAIAEAGGIPALVEIYEVTCEAEGAKRERVANTRKKILNTEVSKRARLFEKEDAQRGDRERLAEILVQIMKMLELLSSNMECQSHFKMKWNVLWPFFHCISDIAWYNKPYYPNEKDKIVVENQKDIASYRDCVASAGKALWQLSLNNKHKAVLVSLSQLKSKSIRDIHQILDEEAAANRFDDFLQWSKWVSESRKFKNRWMNIRLEEDQKREEYFHCPQIDLYDDISSCLKRLSWSLSFDDETGLAIAECWYHTQFSDLQSFQELFSSAGDDWINTVTHYVGISKEEKKNCANSLSCLKILIAKLGENNATRTQRARALKVLWFCCLVKNDIGFSPNEDDSTIEDALAKLCEALVNAATEDEMEQIFWATGILTNLTWLRSTPKNFANAAKTGAQRIVMSGSGKFGFLPRFIDAKVPGKMNLDLFSAENEGVYGKSVFLREYKKRAQKKRAQKKREE